MNRSEFWRFETARFAVVAYAYPETDDPAGQFDDPRDVEAIRNGTVEWFGVTVEVQTKPRPGYVFGKVIGSGHLGGCAYNSVAEFATGHRDPDPENRNTLAMKARKRAICHYFPDMVSEAIADARQTMGRLRPVKSAA